MPNECMNTLGIMGKKKDVDKFIKFVNKGTDQIKLFNSLIPMPKELDDSKSAVNTANKGNNAELVSKYGADNWYDWGINNWGTKWGDYELTSSEIAKAYGEDEWHIAYNYTTAWSPGENELINAIIKQFPKLKVMLQYEEPGMAFAGETLALNGRIVKQEQWIMHELSEDITEVYWLQYEESVE